jgi:hypothetical protein
MPDEWEREDMAKKWSQLGFVVEKKSAGKVKYVESERTSGA